MFSTRLLSFIRRPVLNVVCSKFVPKVPTQPARNYSYSSIFLQNSWMKPQDSLLRNPTLINISNQINSRTVIKFSIRKGKRKAVKTVLKRFYRLNWGGWVRTIAGRHRKMWAKRGGGIIRSRQHVLCNATQSTLLDKMVTSYWRRPKYYVDDPYEPYHSREEWAFTYKKPKPYCR